MYKHATWIVWGTDKGLTWEYTVKAVNIEKFVFQELCYKSCKKKRNGLYSSFACLLLCLSLAVGYSPFSALFFLFSPTRRIWHLFTRFRSLFRRSFNVIAALQGLKLLLLRPSPLLSASVSQNVWPAVWAQSCLHWQSGTFLVALVVVEENLEHHSQQANQVIDNRFSLTEKCYSADIHSEKSPGTDWRAHQQMNEATKIHAAHLVSLNNSHKTFLQL